MNSKSTSAVCSKAAVFVNEAAGQERGGKRWRRIARAVLERLPERTVVMEYRGKLNYQTILPRLIEEGVSCFVAAGGDGSVNRLLNALFECERAEPSRLMLGAIGLGSSNDFHKPAGDSIAGVPLRIGRRFPQAADVGQVRYGIGGEETQRRFFIVNASLGVTAEANAFFNRGDPFLRFLKKRLTGPAIWYAALRTFAAYENFPATLEHDGLSAQIALSNLAVVKIPYVSGQFRYPSLADVDDGRLALFTLEDMTRLELIRTLFDLTKGRFEPSEKRKTAAVAAVHIEVDRPVALETDGEIARGTSFTFSVIPKGINLLTNHGND